MNIELDNEEIEKIINCVKYTMEQFCEGPMFIEYQVLIDSLEMQRGKYNQGGSFGQFMDWARPPTRRAPSGPCRHTELNRMKDGSYTCDNPACGERIITAPRNTEEALDNAEQ